MGWVLLKKESTAEKTKACIWSCLWMHDILVKRWADLQLMGVQPCLEQRIITYCDERNLPRYLSGDFSTHCLELAINKSLKTVTDTNHLSTFFESGLKPMKCQR